MTWKLFETPYHRKVAVYCIRITPEGKIFFSRSLVRKLKLTSNNVAQVWYDSTSKEIAISIGLAFDAAPLAIRGINQQNVFINANGFFKFFNLKPAAKDIKLQVTFSSTYTLTATLP